VSKTTSYARDTLLHMPRRLVFEHIRFSYVSPKSLKI